MRRVLVAHIDSPVGRRLAKALYHDPEVALVFGTGTGPRPSAPPAPSPPRTCPPPGPSPTHYCGRHTS